MTVALLDLPEFVIERCAAFLPATSIAHLVSTNAVVREQLNSSEVINWLARTREGALFIRADRIWTLQTLAIAEIRPPHETVLFEFGCLDIANEEDISAGLRSVAALLSRFPDAGIRVRVDGHVQLGAPEPIATHLSKQRAEVVARAMVEVYRLDKEAIDVYWHSSDRQIDSIYLQHPNAAASRNRRAEVTVVYNAIGGEAPADAEEICGRGCQEERRKWRMNPPSATMLAACAQFLPSTSRPDRQPTIRFLVSDDYESDLVNDSEEDEDEQDGEDESDMDSDEEAAPLYPSEPTMLAPPQQEVEVALESKVDAMAEEEEEEERTVTMQREDGADSTKRAAGKAERDERRDGPGCADEGASGEEAVGKNVEGGSSSSASGGGGGCMPTLGRAVLDDADYELFDFRPLRRRRR